MEGGLRRRGGKIIFPSSIPHSSPSPATYCKRATRMAFCCAYRGCVRACVVHYKIDELCCTSFDRQQQQHNIVDWHGRRAVCATTSFTIRPREWRRRSKLRARKWNKICCCWTPSSFAYSLQHTALRMLSMGAGKKEKTPHEERKEKGSLLPGCGVCSGWLFLFQKFIPTRPEGEAFYEL